MTRRPAIEVYSFTIQGVREKIAELIAAVNRHEQAVRRVADNPAIVGSGDGDLQNLAHNLDVAIYEFACESLDSLGPIGGVSP